MTDTRELILERLRVLFATLPGVGDEHSFRNRLRIPDEMLPAIAILDGDDTPDDSGYGRGRPANGPIICTMQPEVYFFLATNKPTNVGTDLNAMRLRMIQLVLNDETLLGLCKDRDIRYLGFSTGLGIGRSLEGEGAIAFAFVYVLRPKSL